MRLKYTVLIVVLMLVAVMPQAALAQDGGDTYQQLVTRAISELGVSCADLEVNSACVGFPQVEAAFTDESSLTSAGDRAPLTALTSIHTMAASEDAATWGVATLHVQADLPFAADPVVLVMFGDVTLENNVAAEDALIPGAAIELAATSDTYLYAAPAMGADVLLAVADGATLYADGLSQDGSWLRVLYEDQAGWVSVNSVDVPAGLPVVEGALTAMQSFSFAANSVDGLPSFLMIQAPDNMTVTLMINGDTIIVEGTLLLTSQDAVTHLYVVEGTTTAFPEAVNEVELLPGTSVEMAEAEWSEWRVPGNNEWGTFEMVESVPNNVVARQVILPKVQSGSTIDDGPCIIVILPTGIICVPYP